MIHRIRLAYLSYLHHLLPKRIIGIPNGQISVDVWRGGSAGGCSRGCLSIDGLLWGIETYSTIPQRVIESEFWFDNRWPDFPNRCFVTRGRFGQNLVHGFAGYGLWLCVAGYGLTAMGCWILVAGYGLLAMGCLPSVAGHRLLVMGCLLRVAGYGLLAIGCWLRIACYGFPGYELLAMDFWI